MTDLRFKTPPPGREAIAAAIQTLIDLLDALTPDSDFEFADDQWEGYIFEDMEEDDPAGGAIDDEPHDEAMDAGRLSLEAHSTGRSWGIDQRFIVTDPGPYSDSLPLKHSHAWFEAERPCRRDND